MKTMPCSLSLELLLKARIHCFPRNPLSNDSLANVLITASGLKREMVVEFRHPADLDSDDIQAVFAEAAYEYRTATIGYGSLAAACFWSTWAIPNGGWLVLLFKQLALPLFGLYNAARGLEAHTIACGAETVETAIKSGSVEFQVDSDS